MVGIKKYHDEEIRFILESKSKGVGLVELLKTCKARWPKSQHKESGLRYVFNKYKNDPKFCSQPMPNGGKILGNNAQSSRSTQNNVPSQIMTNRKQRDSHDRAAEMRVLAGGQIRSSHNVPQPMNLLPSGVNSDYLLHQAIAAQQMGIETIEGGGDNPMTAHTIIPTPRGNLGDVPMQNYQHISNGLQHNQYAIAHAPNSSYLPSYSSSSFSRLHPGGQSMEHPAHSMRTPMSQQTPQAQLGDYRENQQGRERPYDSQGQEMPWASPDKYPRNTTVKASAPVPNPFHTPSTPANMTFNNAQWQNMPIASGSAQQIGTPAIYGIQQGTLQPGFSYHPRQSYQNSPIIDPTLYNLPQYRVIQSSQLNQPMMAHLSHGFMTSQNAQSSGMLNQMGLRYQNGLHGPNNNETLNQPVSQQVYNPTKMGQDSAIQTPQTGTRMFSQLDRGTPRANALVNQPLMSTSSRPTPVQSDFPVAMNYAQYANMHKSSVTTPKGNSSSFVQGNASSYTPRATPMPAKFRVPALSADFYDIMGLPPPPSRTKTPIGPARASAKKNPDVAPATPTIFFNKFANTLGSQKNGQEQFYNSGSSHNTPSIPQNTSIPASLNSSPAQLDHAVQTTTPSLPLALWKSNPAGNPGFSGSPDFIIQAPTQVQDSSTLYQNLDVNVRDVAQFANTNTGSNWNFFQQSPARTNSAATCPKSQATPLLNTSATSQHPSSISTPQSQGMSRFCAPSTQTLPQNIYAMAPFVQQPLPEGSASTNPNKRPAFFNAESIAQHQPSAHTVQATAVPSTPARSHRKRQASSSDEEPSAKRQQTDSSSQLPTPMSRYSSLDSNEEKVRTTTGSAPGMTPTPTSKANAHSYTTDKYQKVGSHEQNIQQRQPRKEVKSGNLPAELPKTPPATSRSARDMTNLDGAGDTPTPKRTLVEEQTTLPPSATGPLCATTEEHTAESDDEWWENKENEERRRRMEAEANDDFEYLFNEVVANSLDDPLTQLFLSINAERSSSGEAHTPSGEEIARKDS